MFLVLLGTPSLGKLLQIIERKDETQWRELKALLVDRTSNINVVASGNRIRLILILVTRASPHSFFRLQLLAARVLHS